MTTFTIWLETDESESRIRDQLATALNMQSNKDSLNRLDIEAFRQPIIKALEQSKGTFLQFIPAERFLAAQQWVRTIKGADIGKLIGILSGRESVDPMVPAKKSPPKTPETPTPEVPSQNVI